MVEIGGREEVVLQRPAIDSFIPSEFVANKQTLWACYFVLDGCGAVHIHVGGERFVTGARHLCVSRPAWNPIREGGPTYQKPAVVPQTVVCGATTLTVEPLLAMTQAETLGVSSAAVE